MFWNHIKSQKCTTTSRNKFQTYFRFYDFLEAKRINRNPNVAKVHYFVVFWLAQNFPGVPPELRFRSFSIPTTLSHYNFNVNAKMHQKSSQRSQKYLKPILCILNRIMCIVEPFFRSKSEMSVLAPCVMLSNFQFGENGFLV